MAAVTGKVAHSGVIGNLKYALVDVVGPASYTGSGGDGLDLETTCGMTTIIFALGGMITVPMPIVNATIVSYDRTNKKMQAFGTAANVKGATETTNGTDLSANTFRFFVLGH